jgi:hypothetical protein
MFGIMERERKKKITKINEWISNNFSLNLYIGFRNFLSFYILFKNQTGPKSMRE